MPVTHWIYPTNAASNYELTDADSAGDVTPQRLLASIERAPDEVADWPLSTGFRIMQAGEAVWVYAADPYQHLCALAEVLDVYADEADGGWHVDLLWNLDATRELMARPIPRSAFGQIAQRAAVRADPTTTGVLDTWLSSQDLQLGSLNDARQRVLRSIVQRRGQARFRQRLLSAYDGQCAITGTSTPAVLEAAHINPYRGDHTNQVTNGLLLRSDLHSLFDLHLIGVDNTGRIVVSSALDATPYATYRGQPLTLPRRGDRRPSKRSLAAHLALLHSKDARQQSRVAAEASDYPSGMSAPARTASQATSRGNASDG